MMKSKINKLKYTSAVLLAGLFAFASCGETDTDVVQPTPQSGDSTIINLTLNAEAILPEVDGVRNMTFDVSKDIPTVLQSSTWDTHVFFRKKGDATFVGYALVQWNVTGVVNGRVQLKQKNTNITLVNNNGKSPVAGEEWYVAGVAGGGVLNAAKNGVSFAYNAAIDGALAPNQARVPFSFPWTKLTVGAGNLTAANISLNPQGALVHIIATNKTGAAVNKAFQVKSSVLDRNGSFNFAVAQNPETGFATGTAKAPWAYTTSTASVVTHSVKMAGANNTDMHGLVWGMPRTGTAASTEIVGAVRKGSSTPAVSSKVYKSGKAYYAKVDVTVPDNPFVLNKYPFDYIAGFLKAVPPLGTTAVVNSRDYLITPTASTRNDASVLFYNRAEATAVQNRLPGYKIPTMQELCSIVPTNLLNDQWIRYGTTNLVDVPEVVTLGGRTFNVTSDYYSPSGSKIIYGIRFKEGSDFSKRMAYKYEQVGTFTTTDVATNYTSKTKISMKVIGYDPLIDINYISAASTSTAFWSSADVKVAYFPSFGYYYEGQRVWLGSDGVTWAQNQGIAGCTYMMVGGQETASLGDTSKVPMLFFKVNP